MLLYKSGAKETKKLLQTPSISPQCLETSEGREWHITPSGALIFPHGSTREAACRTLTYSLQCYPFNSAASSTNFRQKLGQFNHKFHR